MGERLNGIQEVRGSIPLASMAWQRGMWYASSKCSEDCHDGERVCAVAFWDAKSDA